MACFHPLSAWQRKSGEIVFKEPADGLRALSLPCGQCVGCRLERSREMAVRIMHEASMWDDCCFVTLTYDELESYSLVYRHFQLFMKKLRKKYVQHIRFFMCGEYGDQFGRPHFHACLFGVSFPDREYLRTLPSGFKIYRSAILESIWTKGYSSIGDVTFDSAAYVARYCMKKVTGNNAHIHYNRVHPVTGEDVQLEPEFSHMSLKPGIGYNWFEKYCREVYPVDQVVMNGKVLTPPRRYDEWMKSMPEVFSEIDRIDVETSRIDKAMLSEHDNTAERLNVREIVAKARLNLKKRGLE